MGILARLSPKAAAQSTQSFDAMNHEMVKRAFGGAASSAGKMVNENAVLGISAAWACRRILSESIGMLPWSMFRKEANGNAEKADDYWLHDVLVQSPNREQTSVEFREVEAMGLTGDGNAYSLIERLGKRITSLTPIFDVEPMRKSGSNTTESTIAEGDIFFRFKDRGRTVDYPRDKVWQVKGFGHSLLRGLSPIGAAREAMGGALAQEEFANRFFAQGGMPAGTVTFPGWLSPEQKLQAKEAMQEMIGGLGKAHQMALFQGGMKPEPWNTMNLEEMQFIVARRFSVLEICRFYRVPPHMVAELEKGASYASIEQMSQEFVMFTLMPYLTRLEASVSKWLIPAEDRRRYFLRFNYEGLLRADSKGRAEMYASAVQNGWMTRNEVRAKENLNRADELDGFTAQTNLASVERILEGDPENDTAPPPERDSNITVNLPQAAPESSLQLVLPEAISKQMKYTVDHPALQEVVALTKSVEARMEQRMSELEQSTRQSIGALEQSTAEAVAALERSTAQSVKALAEAAAGSIAAVERVARMPRKAIVKNQDTPEETIYSVVVDESEVIH